MLNVLASVVTMIVCVVVMVTPFVNTMYVPVAGSGKVVGAAFGGFFLALLLLVSPRWVELNAPDYKPRFFRIYQQRGLFICLPAMIFLLTMVSFKLITHAIKEDEGISESIAFQNHWRWLFALIAVTAALATMGAVACCVVVVRGAYARATR